MNPGIDLSCAKKIIIGKPYTGQCEPDQEKDVGLCYKKCDTAYKGIGPVCWGKNPNNWVGCGMGSAVTTKVCVDIIMGQIFSVGQMALNVVTLGATATASSALGDIKKLKEQYENLVKMYEAASERADIIIAAQKDPEYSEIVKDAEESKTTDPNKVMPEDLARIAASIAALVDPSGIAGTIAAFTYAKCSKIFGSYSA